jgi:hypothetical protein
MKILLIIILIIILFILIIGHKENLKADVEERKKKNITENTENTDIKDNDKKTEYSSLIPNNIKQGDSDKFNDSVFNDVKMYMGERTLEGELGLEKCIKGCDGMCVEYGITGDAFCFPKRIENESEKFTKFVNPELLNSARF